MPSLVGPGGTAVRGWKTAAVVGVLCLALTACKGSVADPVGDATQVDDPKVDIVEAGVDFGTATTTLWVRYAPGAGPASSVAWSLSTDGDTIPGYTVHLTPSANLYSVQGPGFEEVCAGSRPDREFDGRDELVIDTSCIPSPTTGSPSSTLRIAASTHSLRYSHDETGWTRAIGRG